MANGKQTHVIAVSLPKELFRELEELRARLFRKRSEVVKEAVRQYVERNRGLITGLSEAPAPYEEEIVTRAEQAAFRRGEAEYRQGEYLTLEELRAHLRKRRKRSVAPRRH